jgi:hypothetical protein
LTFRFASGSFALDKDIERLANYLKQPGVSGRRFLIVGFADADGNWSHNQRLAAKRALTVGALLQHAGAPVSRKNLQSLSYMAPVAMNEAGDRVRVAVGSFQGVSSPLVPAEPLDLSYPKLADAYRKSNETAEARDALRQAEP